MKQIIAAVILAAAILDVLLHALHDALAQALLAHAYIGAGKEREGN